MSTLDDAITIAVKIHRGQKDRYGAPYILHPIRVMMRVENEIEKIVAILHDVVEDSDMTLDDLKDEGFSVEIINAIDCVTKRENEPYLAYIERTKQNKIAIKVKIADLEDNLDIKRADKVNEKDSSRFDLYLKVWKELKKLNF